MTVVPGMTAGVSTILLLAASTLSSGGWAGGGDAINTKRGVEHPRPSTLHPPHPPTPLRVIPPNTRAGAPSNTDTRGSHLHTSSDDDYPSGSPPQSSTSQQFFQSSSLYQPSLKNSQMSWAAGGRTTAGGQPYHLSELPPSSPPPQVPLWPDPPPAAPPSSTPATRVSSTLPTALTAGGRTRGSLLTNHNKQRKTRLRQDFFTLGGTRKHRRMSQDALTPSRSGRKHHQPLGFGGNGRYLKTNIQVDRGKLPSRKKLRGFLENKDSLKIGRTDRISEDDDYLQDDSESLSSTEEKPEGVEELLAGKRNMTGQGLQQPPEHSKETRHEKLTRNFPAQLSEQGESTEALSEELTETQLRGGEEGTGRENKNGITDTADRGVDSWTEPTDNPRDLGVNGTTLDKPQKVNLDTLEMELSERDEEAASDLLLAISILQRHIVPDTSMPRPTHNTSGPVPQPLVDHSRLSDNPQLQPDFHSTPTVHKSNKKYNIEIFNALSPSSDETTAETEGVMEETSLQQTTSLQEGPDMRSSRYRWFVLVLDGNCSVIKQRMTTFVTFLKAALSAKLTVDYNDVYVPSVFCDNTFMVNISLDTHKYPQVEMRLRKLAEANTTLLEISEEIFYLEKILTKRSDEEDQNFQPIIKKPDDVELVIYIAVGCMCVFILLSVVIVMLIRVCRQEGDPLDLGKPHPHQIIPRSLDFPIRRPNVIYSHRFSQALIPGKCGRRGLDEGQLGGGSSSGVAVVAVGGGGGARGSLLRYDPEVAGEVIMAGDEVYSISAMADDSYSDRRALVPARRRTRHIPGEDVILEEDLVEEEEEEEEERRRRVADLPEDEVLLEDDMDEEGDSSQDHRPPETPRAVPSSRGMVRTVLGTEGAGRGRVGMLGAGPNDVVVTGSGDVLSGIDNPCYNR